MSQEDKDSIEYFKAVIKYLRIIGQEFCFSYEGEMLTINYCKGMIADIKKTDNLLNLA